LIIALLYFGKVIFQARLYLSEPLLNDALTDVVRDKIYIIIQNQIGNSIEINEFNKLCLKAV